MFIYRPNLPLLQAYIYENLRYKTVTPILLPHRAIRDTELAGYKVRDIITLFYITITFLLKR